jgi:hypothetical protein
VAEIPSSNELTKKCKLIVHSDYVIQGTVEFVEDSYYFLEFVEIIVTMDNKYPSKRVLITKCGNIVTDHYISLQCWTFGFQRVYCHHVLRVFNKTNVRRYNLDCILFLEITLVKQYCFIL